MLDWIVLCVTSSVDVESEHRTGDQFCCVGLVLYVQIVAQSHVGMRLECSTRSYGHQGGSTAPQQWPLGNMSDSASGLVELSSSTSTILLETPDNIPR